MIGLLAERYRPDLKILEVGSGSAGITEFLAHRVTGVDPAFERTAERRSPLLDPVVAAADALPFPDAAFDVVLSLEMLEHVPSQMREPCLSEMFRVLRPGGRMVVTFPSDETAARLDAWLNEAFRRRAGFEHPWSSEHLRNGVPRAADVAATVRRVVGDAGDVTVRRHQWAGSFRLVHGLYTARRFAMLTRRLGLHTRAAARVIFMVCRRLHRPPTYRTILVVDRRR